MGEPPVSVGAVDGEPPFSRVPVHVDNSSGECARSGFDLNAEEEPEVEAAGVAGPGEQVGAKVVGRVLRGTTLYASTFRFDDVLLVNTHAFGV